jgi:hypothetical protein
MSLKCLILYLVQLNIFLSIYHIFVKLLYLVPLIKKYMFGFLLCVKRNTFCFNLTVDKSSSQIVLEVRD